MNFKKKYAVIIITNFYFPTVGGISTYISSLLEPLNKEEHYTRVIQFPTYFRKIENLISNKLLHNIAHFFFVLIFIFYAEIVILVRKIEYRKLIVHSHSSSFCLIISTLTKMFGTKTIHTFHSPSTGRSRILEYFSPLVDAMVFVSKATQEQYQTHSKIKNNLIFVIPGGVDGTIFYPRIETEQYQLIHEFAAKYEIGENNRLILFSGRLVEDKGVIPLIKSIAIVKEQIPNTKLIVVGPYDKTVEQRSYYKLMNNTIYESNLENSILFTGVVSFRMLIDLYSVCDIFVCPSLWQEPSPMVVVEAMASGKPVIATNVGGLPERIINDINGYIVEAGDQTALALKIITLLKDDTLRIQMGNNARKIFDQYYSIEVISNEHIKLYDSLFNFQ